MSDQLHLPRTLQYEILRVCERLHLPEDQFLAMPYPQQLHLLAYHRLRLLEEHA
ncbi:MAG: hypothetical protein KDA58_12840 [Planctomycetaceae bacterium]|nr:hypothetical protein [Planctomycetaceae bacterium]